MVKHHIFIVGGSRRSDDHPHGVILGIGCDEWHPRVSVISYYWFSIRIELRVKEKEIFYYFFVDVIGVRA